jgi:two-component system CheB/CheR fusion protein
VDGHAELCIEDDGEGIEPSFLSQVFDMFQQSRTSDARSKGGLGIGLALVKRLVDLHVGEVHAQSAGPGRGSSFIVRFPLFAAPLPEQSLEPDARALDGVRLLLVDPVLETRSALHALLSLAGAEVESAASEGDAMQVASGSRFDVLLVDLAANPAIGQKLLKAMRTDAGDLPLSAIALSGSATQKGGAAEHPGYDEVIRKPVDTNALVELLARASRQFPR